MKKYYVVYEYNNIKKYAYYSGDLNNHYGIEECREYLRDHESIYIIILSWVILDE